MAELAFRVPAKLRRGKYQKDEQREVESAVEIIKLICRNFGLDDLGASSVLDVGCGCKLVQAILDRHLSIGRYVGIDVYAELIEFLRSNVSDPRFSFHVLNAHNEMYNLDGEPLSGNTRLPVEEHSFDIICLFSVFTHLAPHDYVAMLQMLRHYIKPDGRILFSLYVNEPTDGGFGFIDAYGKAFMKMMESSDELKAAYAEKVESYVVPDFKDFFPAEPLKVAMYSRENALRLVQGTGWEVESLNDPEKAIQHYMICKPI